MTDAAMAVITLSLAAVCYWQNVVPKVVAWLCLIGGAGLSNAFLGEWTRTLAGWAAGFAGDITDPDVGEALVTALAVAALAAFAFGVWPKRRAYPVTAAAALLLPSLWVGVGGDVGTAVNDALTSITDGATTAATNMFWD